MMINEQLWAEAERLAARRYAITYERDILSNGQRVFILRHPELPAVKAQGSNEAEAQRNLDEARVDYIYTLLVDDLPVPVAQTVSSTDTNTNSPNGSGTWTINTILDEREATSVSEDEFVLGLSFGGDLVKQR